MIHHFCGSGVRDFKSLPADILEESLAYLVDNGYTAMHLSDYVNSLVNKKRLYKAVVFTVDDGYRDFLQYGFPVFSKFNIPVSVFITTQFIDGQFKFWWDKIRVIIYQTKFDKIEVRLGEKTIPCRLTTTLEKERTVHTIIEHSKQLLEDQIDKVIQELISACGISEIRAHQDALSWDEIIELDAHGVEFYPHTCKHPILSHCSDSQIKEEIYASQDAVAFRLQKPSKIFCYPNGRYGDFDDRAVEILKRAGFIAAFTSEEGFDRSGDKLDMFRLHRYAFSFDANRFKQIVSGLESLKYSIRSVLRGFAKRS